MNGYVPIPNRDKACYLQSWSTVHVNEHQVKLWARQNRWPAIGLRVEPPLLVLDFDLPDIDIVRAIEDITPSVVFDALERHGNVPKTAFFLRLDIRDEPFYRLSTHRYLRAKEPFRIEAFAGGGGGKQIGSFGPHSHDEHGNVLRTYAWVNDRSPANTHINQLPILRRAELSAFLDAAEALLAAWPELEKDTRSRSGEKQFNSHVYDLSEESVFHDGEGFEYTLTELTADAKGRAEMGEPNLFVTGSFTDDPTSSGKARAKVWWSARHGLSIVDFKTDITHHVVHAAPENPKLDRADARRAAGEIPQGRIAMAPRTPSGAAFGANAARAWMAQHGQLNEHAVATTFCERYEFALAL